jgi:hypothetical protein
MKADKMIGGKMNKNLYFGLLLVSSLAFVGCGDPNAAAEEMPTASNKKPAKDYVPKAIAGVDKDVAKSLDPSRLKGLIAATSRFGSRANPFALSADEIAFDQLQASERLLSENGTFGTEFELPEDKQPEELVVAEEQPIRRLSGIVIGDAIYAILEENGQSTIVRPGSMIPNTDWKVVSIDSERAILRRTGSKRPNEIEVKLQVGLPSAPAGGGSDGGAFGGPPGGGMPPAGGGPGGAPPGGGRPGGTKGGAPRAGGAGGRG